MRHKQNAYNILSTLYGKPNIALLFDNDGNPKRYLEHLTLGAPLFLWSYSNSPLRQFPGPILARFTGIWRLLDVYRSRCDRTHLRLHRKHGSVVRMGPNVLSPSDLGLINRVYTTKGAWAKVGGSLNLFLWLYTDGCTNRS